MIEQSQILTTHNLAQLVDRLGLTSRVTDSGAEWTTTAFAWIVKEQNTRYDSWRSQLQMLKNTAYAFRQALFFLSFANATEQARVVSELGSLAASEPDEWRARFGPVLDGLDAIRLGGSFDALGRSGPSARRFLGWSVGRHWLLPAADATTGRAPSEAE